MGFNIFKWFLQKTNTEDSTGVSVPVKDFLDNTESMAVAGLEIYIQRMAFWSIVRKIGAAVSAVEWETYRRGKKIRSREHWAWNHAPNPNQSGEQFFRGLVGKLFLDQQALIVETREGNRYIADGFSVEKHLSGDIYRDIFAEGESIPGVFRADDVMYLSIEGESISRIMAGIASAEGRLLKSASKKYVRDNGTKGILHIDTNAETSKNFEEEYADLVDNKFKKYFAAENAVLPMFQGYEFTERDEAKGSTKTDLVGTRDIRNMMDDIVELTAQAMGVPVSIATGKDIKDSEFKAFMTFSVQPIVTLIADEINRKVFNRDLVYAGTYIVPNYGAVRYTDLFDVANPIDKLIGSGAFCINDIRVRLGLDVIDEPWAWQHWMTKNYSSVEDLLTGMGNNEEPASRPEEKEETNEQKKTEETGSSSEE